MMFNIDKRFLELLCAQGASVTWEQFRSAYDLRKAERESDPRVVARRRREEEAELRFLSQLEAEAGLPVGDAAQRIAALRAKLKGGL